jgi:hypothetical protein
MGRTIGILSHPGEEFVFSSKCLDHLSCLMRTRSSFLSRIKGSERQAIHSLQSSIEVRKHGALRTFPHTPLRLDVRHRGKFTSTNQKLEVSENMYTEV